MNAYRYLRALVTALEHVQGEIEEVAERLKEAQKYIENGGDNE